MDGWLTIGTKLETKEFDKQIADLEKELENMEKSYSTYIGKKGLRSEDKEDFRQLGVQIEKTRNKLVGLYNQKMKLEKSGGFDLMNSSLASAIKKAGRLVLGIFSIRSAYMALRRASSDLATYDPQYATNLEYIRWVLTQAIAPVLKWIVNTVGTILQYLYAILNAWFGIGAKIDLSAESFNKMKKGANGVSKAVKQIKRDLLGFDEVNRLTGQSSTGTSAGAGGVGIPDFELGGLKEVPEWLQWIIDNKQKVLDILTAIGAIIGAYKIATFLGNLKAIYGTFKGMIPVLAKVFTKFKGISGLKLAGMFAGIVIAITGVVQTIQAVIKYIEDPTWNNFIGILKGIETALIGVGVAMVAFNATNPVGWIILAIGAIGKLTTALFEDKREILSVEEAQRKLNETRNKYVDAVERAEEAERNLIEVEQRNKMSGEELFNEVERGTLDFKDMTEAQRETYKAYLATKDAQESLSETTKELTQDNLNEKLSVAEKTQSYHEFKEAVVKAYEEGSISAEEARDILETAMKDMSNSATETFLWDIPDAIKEGINPDNYSSFFTKFKRKWDSFFDNLSKDIYIYGNFSIGGGAGGGRRKHWR